MFARGPQPGYSAKQDALEILPRGTYCRRRLSHDITGYVVFLPDGTPVASAGNAQKAWEKAAERYR